jgi:hypothetical protein
VCVCVCDKEREVGINTGKDQGEEGFELKLVS